jgi:hypothetical protein
VSSLDTRVRSSSKSGSAKKPNDQETSLDKIDEKSCTSCSCDEEDEVDDAELENAISHEDNAGEEVDEDREFTMKNYFKTLESSKNTSKLAEYRKNFDDEVKTIKVGCFSFEIWLYKRVI